MDATSGIASAASAASLAQTQMAASTQILKLAQTAAAAPTAALLDAAMENVQACIESMAKGLGGNVDAMA